MNFPYRYFFNYYSRFATLLPSLAFGSTVLQTFSFYFDLFFLLFAACTRYISLLQRPPPVEFTIKKVPTIWSSINHLFSHFPHASHTFSFLLNTIVDRISNLNVIEIPVITGKYSLLDWQDVMNVSIHFLMIKRCISERNLPIAIISCFFSFLLDFYVRIESSNL